MDIKRLEATLAERMEAVEKQRLADEQSFAEKKQAREAALAAAITAQKADAEAKLKARLDREEKQRAAYVEWERTERERRNAEDQENIRMEAERQTEEARVRGLQDQLIQLEFAEEQRQRAMDQMLPQIVQTEIVDGPDGQTPITSEMSDHLKRILRQDRDFNV